MILDLQEDFKTVFAYVEKRIHNYSTYSNSGPGKAGQPISQITLGYSFEQSGWIALVFDTRPHGGVDGEWSLHVDENLLDLGHWCDACSGLCEEGSTLDIILHDGLKKRLNHEESEIEEVAAYFGMMLIAVLMAARDSGLFAKLPLTKECLMVVSDNEGYFGWPPGDDIPDEGNVN